MERGYDRLIRAAMREYNAILEEIDIIKKKDPAAKSRLEVALLYSGFHAVLAHRLAHALYKKGHFFTARAISQVTKFVTGVEIHPGAKIGKGLFIDHGDSVVIGETAEIGDGCTIYQGVTLGGTGKDCGKRHPTLGNNVMVGAGAKVLGPFRVGDNAKIAANAVVLKEVPEGTTAVGIPAKLIRDGKAKRENENMDHTHMPDPVSKEMKKLRERIAALEKEIEKLEGTTAEKADGAAAKRSRKPKSGEEKTEE